MDLFDEVSVSGQSLNSAASSAEPKVSPVKGVKRSHRDDANSTPKPSKKLAAHGLVGTCIIPNCQGERYCRMRICKHHKTFWDMAMYQATNPKEGESKCDKELRAQLDDDQMCIECIQLYESAIPADATLNPAKKRKKKGQAPRFVHQAQFRKRFGIRTSRKVIDAEKPTEKGEFVKIRVDRGWPQDEAQAAWTDAIRGREIADYKGRKGAPRYWLEQDQVRTREREVFEDDGVDESSELLRDATPAQMQALRNFAHASSEHADEVFLSGARSSGTVDDGNLLNKVLGKDIEEEVQDPDMDRLPPDASESVMVCQTQTRTVVLHEATSPKLPMGLSLLPYIFGKLILHVLHFKGILPKLPRSFCRLTRELTLQSQSICFATWLKLKLKHARSPGVFSEMLQLPCACSPGVSTERLCFAHAVLGIQIFAFVLCTHPSGIPRTFAIACSHSPAVFSEHACNVASGLPRLRRLQHLARPPTKAWVLRDCAHSAIKSCRSSMSRRLGSWTNCLARQGRCCSHLCLAARRSHRDLPPRLSS